MEHLNLHTGRFIPRADLDADARIRALETHLAGLTAELEHMLAEIDATLDLLEAGLRAQERNAAMAADGDIV